MPLIDRTYFDGGELNIPGMERLAVRENVETMIQKREPELLMDLFGVKMYTDFMEGLSDDPIPSKWSDLKNGVTYQDAQGEYFHWRGLTNINKESLVANYVFYWWLRQNITQTTSVGEISSNIENASRVAANQKMIKAWNEMVKWIAELSHFLETHSSEYPELRRNAACKWKNINAFNI